MPKLIASKPFRYGGKALTAGEPFEATRGDARALVAISRATYSVAVPAVEVEKQAEPIQSDEVEPPRVAVEPKKPGRQKKSQ